LFVTEAAGVAVYPITSTTGALGTVVSGSPFAAGTNPYSVRVDNADQYVYVGNDGSADVSEYSLNSSTGVLTPMAGSPIAAGTFPNFIATD
jgi:6-phosphogluconolactonase (cycloisomerase 2 family)